MVGTKHQQLLEMTKALRFQEGLPKQFWANCLLTGTHIINRLPTSANNFSIPYESLFHKPPNYQALRCFGCLCYALVRAPDILEPRDIKSIFSG